MRNSLTVLLLPLLLAANNVDYVEIRNKRVPCESCGSCTPMRETLAECQFDCTSRGNSCSGFNFNSRPSSCNDNSGKCDCYFIERSIEGGCSEEDVPSGAKGFLSLWRKVNVSEAPTVKPTRTPTGVPTVVPTTKPTTRVPTFVPSASPTAAPLSSGTVSAAPSDEHFSTTHHPSSIVPSIDSPSASSSAVPSATVSSSPSASTEYPTPVANFPFPERTLRPSLSTTTLASLSPTQPPLQENDDITFDTQQEEDMQQKEGGTSSIVLGVAVGTAFLVVLSMFLVLAAYKRYDMAAFRRCARLRKPNTRRPVSKIENTSPTIAKQEMSSDTSGTESSPPLPPPRNSSLQAQCTNILSSLSDV